MTCLRPADTRNQEGGTTSARYEVERGEPVYVRPGTRNQAGETSSGWYKVTRLDGMSSSVQYEKSSWREFVHPVLTHAKGGLDLVCLVRSRTKGGLVLVRPV